MLNLGKRIFHTDFAGLFLFAIDLASMQLDPMLAAVGMSGTSMIPAGCAVRFLLALKLSGIGRPSQVMAETPDESLALVARLNTISYHGNQALLQKHYVSKRRRQRGVLTTLARGADAPPSAMPLPRFARKHKMMPFCGLSTTGKPRQGRLRKSWSLTARSPCMPIWQSSPPWALTSLLCGVGMRR